MVQPEAQAVTNYVELTGNAAAIDSVKLVARVEGYLESQNFADGAIARKGDLLLTIQQDQYKAQLIQAQAQLDEAKAGIEYARTEIIRYKALVKQEAAAQTEVDHWIFEKASAEAKLLSAQAQVTLTQLNLNYTEIRAPFDGQMTKGQIDPGNLVGSPGQQATPLAEIYQIDPIYVVANLSEQDLLKIRSNLDQARLTLAQLIKVPIDVALQDESTFSHRGTLEYVGRRLIRRPAHCLCAASWPILIAPCSPAFSSACACPWNEARRLRCSSLIGRCKRTRADVICSPSTRMALSKSATSNWVR